MEYGRITEEQIGEFARHLREEERSGGTVENYTRSVREFAAQGWAEEADGRWRLTSRGFLVSNQIIGGMLDALAADKQRRAEAAARGDFRVHLD